MAFRKTRPLEATAVEMKPDIIITMGCGEACPLVPGAQRLDWNLSDPAGKSMDFMQNVRDEIEENVNALVKSMFG
jgi:arsenate reductase (thioredoxin)